MKIAKDASLNQEFFVSDYLILQLANTFSVELVYMRDVYVRIVINAALNQWHLSASYVTFSIELDRICVGRTTQVPIIVMQEFAHHRHQSGHLFL